MISISKKERTAQQKAYTELTQTMLKPYGVKIGTQLKGADKEKFYAELKEAWAKKKKEISIECISASSFEDEEAKLERKLKLAITKAKKEASALNLTLDKKIPLKRAVKQAEENYRQFKLNYYARRDAYDS